MSTIGGKPDMNVYACSVAAICEGIVTPPRSMIWTEVSKSSKWCRSHGFKIVACWSMWNGRCKSEAVELGEIISRVAFAVDVEEMRYIRQHGLQHGVDATVDVG